MERSLVERYLVEQTTHLTPPDDSIPCTGAHDDMPSTTSQYIESTDPGHCQNAISSTVPRIDGRPLTQSHPRIEDSHQNKRRKTVGGLRISNSTSSVDGLDTIATASPTCGATTRRLQIKSRGFPQRKRRSDFDVHVLQPSSIDKFVGGIWKQVFSSIELTPTSFVSSSIPISGYSSSC